MTPIKKIATVMFGEDKWQQDMAKALCVDTSSIRRWKTYEGSPGPVRAAMRCFLRERGFKELKLLEELGRAERSM